MPNGLRKQRKAKVDFSLKVDLASVEGGDGDERGPGYS